MERCPQHRPHLPLDDVVDALHHVVNPAKVGSVVVIPNRNPTTDQDTLEVNRERI